MAHKLKIDFPMQNKYRVRFHEIPARYSDLTRTTLAEHPNFWVPLVERHAWVAVLLDGEAPVFYGIAYCSNLDLTSPGLSAKKGRAIAYRRALKASTGVSRDWYFGSYDAEAFPTELINDAEYSFETSFAKREEKLAS